MLQEFVVNIAAGLVIFVLDVVLILWLFPRILDRRLEARWKPTRKAFVEDVTESHRTVVLSLRERDFTWLWNNLEKGKLAEAAKVRKLKDDIAFYVMAFDSETTAFGVEHLRSTEEIFDLIDSIRNVVLNDDLPGYMITKAGENIAALQSKLVQQDQLVRRLRAHVGLPEPESDDNLRMSISALEKLTPTLARRLLSPAANRL